jgi:hypothetical protein
MLVDADIVGRTYPAVGPYLVSQEKVDELAGALGHPSVPPTFPVILSSQALRVFLDAEGLELQRIVHGEQRFTYERPLRVGDVLTATLSVTGLRAVGEASFVTTSTEFRVGEELVCTGKSTVVHR